MKKPATWIGVAGFLFGSRAAEGCGRAYSIWPTAVVLKPAST